jgi:hypothetical protein
MLLHRAAQLLSGCNMAAAICFRRASVGMAGSCLAKPVSQNKANHYFSPRKFASANRAREILDSLRLSLPTVAPGQTPGALRFVSLALHILPQKGGRHRRNVSARKFPNLLHPETHFSSL